MRGPPGSTPLYASQFSGSDIGAQINNMISFAAANGLFHFVIDTPGAISTALNGFALGSVVNVTAGKSR
jgi:hypothetical protein